MTCKQSADKGEHLTTALERAETEPLRKDIDEILTTKKVHPTTFSLDIGNLILDEPFRHLDSILVRPIDRLHVENIKTLLKARANCFSTPFVLVVDPKDCPSVKEWDPIKAKTWKYKVIGGNHGARGKARTLGYVQQANL